MSQRPCPPRACLSTARSQKKGAPPPSRHLARPPTSSTTPLATDGHTHAHTDRPTPHGREEEAAVVARAGCGSGSLESIDAAGAAASATGHTRAEERSRPRFRSTLDGGRAGDNICSAVRRGGFKVIDGFRSDD